MPATITEVTPPVLSESTRRHIKFESGWRILQDGSGGFMNTDQVWWSNDFNIYTHSGMSGSKTSDDMVMNREQWGLYPVGSNYVHRVSMDVRGVFEGEANWGPFVPSGFLFIVAPEKPKVELEVVREEGSRTDVIVRFEVDKGAYNRDVYDTRIMVNAVDSAGRTVKVLQPFASFFEDGELSFEVSSIENGLRFGDTVTVNVVARTRGVAGDSEAVVASHVFGWPATPQITRVARQGNEINGRVVISIDTHAVDGQFPVEKVQLERLTDSPASTPAEAALSEEWEDVDGKWDDGACRGLTDELNDAWPRTKGHRTWYRVRSSAGTYTTVSEPVDLGVYQPPVEAKPGAAEILRAESFEDGSGAIVDVVWGADAFANASAAEIAAYDPKTRLTWGASENAWRSSGGVEEFDFDWEDDVKASPSHPQSGRVYLDGLEEGVAVYLRARRLLEKDDGEPILGPWSGIVAVTPASKPAWVNLSAPACVKRGQGVELTWTYGSDATQTGWSVVDRAGRVWASGTDASGACVIPAERIGDLDELELSVTMTTGGLWTSSEYVLVRVADPPTLTLLALDVIGSTPFYVMADATDGSEVVMSIVSRGLTYATPAGTQRQYANDVVWAACVEPGQVRVEGARLVQGATYELTAYAKDRDTGLTSEAATVEFVVRWDRQAALPDASVEVDEDRLWATIRPVAPAGAQPGDRCEVYRVTPDGALLIAADVEFGSSVLDRYAPFSSGSADVRCAYRVATVTPEGDRAWMDFPYELSGPALRFDWDGGCVELPFNVEVDDGIEKDFGRQKHKDGKVQGFWEPGCEQDVKLTAELDREDCAEATALVKAMANHAGAVLSRMATGQVVCGNVELTSRKESYKDGLVRMGFSVEAIDLTDEFRCRPTDVTGPGEEAS